jgi:hypothetical protein
MKQPLFDLARLRCNVHFVKKGFFLFTACIFLLASCREEYPFYDGQGKKPIYISYDELENITNLPPQPVQKTGTIFWLNDIFFLLEQKKGIHLFDVSDTSNPVPLTFIKIPAVNDFTISNNKLYADNGANLVTIDISDILNISVLNIQRQVFQPIMFPALYSGYFECVDTSKGVVIDWVDAQLLKAKCQIIN